jgi:hypothetical protein
MIRSLGVPVLLAVFACNVTDAALVQWSNASGGNGHFYEAILSSTSVTWEQARALAESRGGHLATLTSAAEDAFVFSLVADQPAYWANSFGGPWLGAYQPNPNVPAASGWVWVTGEAWEYTNWSPGEPGDQGWLGGVESYLHFRDLSGGWNDFTNDGNATYSYIVEYTVPTPGCAILLMALNRRSRRR